MATARICYWVDESMEVDADSGSAHGLRWGPITVVENEPGYLPSIVIFRGDFASARDFVDGLNKELGISREQAMDIVMSSMRLSNIGGQDRKGF